MEFKYFLRVDCFRLLGMTVIIHAQALESINVPVSRFMSGFDDFRFVSFGSVPMCVVEQKYNPCV